MRLGSRTEKILYSVQLCVSFNFQRLDCIDMYHSYWSHVLLPSLVVGWGPVGHTRVAKISYPLLSSTGQVFVKSILGEMDGFAAFVGASTWVDTTEADDAAEYHFVHSTFRTCEPYLESRDCGFNRSGKCLVTGMAHYVSIIVSGASFAEKRDAFRMLIHLVADMHQPLHSGFAEDHGGNDIHFIDNELSLHEIWDSTLVYGLTEESIPTWKQVESALFDEKTYLSNRWPDDAPQGDLVRIVKDWTAAVVSEISSTYTCPIAYKAEGEWIVDRSLSMISLDTMYLSSVADSLLTLAGVRLAVLINRIAAYLKSQEVKAPYVPVKSDTSSQSSNKFSILTIEEFDFDPVEIDALKMESSTVWYPPVRLLWLTRPMAWICLV